MSNTLAISFCTAPDKIFYNCMYGTGLSMVGNFKGYNKGCDAIIKYCGTPGVCVKADCEYKIKFNIPIMGPCLVELHNNTDKT